MSASGVPTWHPDDEAVNRFAAEMKAKLAAAREKGRGGWQDKTQVSAQALSEMLLAHVFKGDPRDVANFAMFLHQRGERITLAAGPHMERAVEAGLIAAAPHLVGRPAAGDELASMKRLVNDLSKIIHDMVVTQQAAWIEWRHGKGADAAMTQIHNALAGPGHIPNEDEPYGKEAQAWFDANCADPLPTCFCGRPSNRLWMGKGFCSAEHQQQRRAEVEATS